MSYHNKSTKKYVFLMLTVFFISLFLFIRIGYILLDDIDFADKINIAYIVPAIAITYFFEYFIAKLSGEKKPPPSIKNRIITIMFIGFFFIDLIIYVQTYNIILSNTHNANISIKWASFVADFLPVIIFAFIAMRGFTRKKEE